MANNPTSGSQFKPASAATPDVAADAHALMDEAKSTAGKIADEAGDQIAGLTERAKQEASAATEKAKSLAGDQKDQIAEQVGGVAAAIERAADDLEANNGEGARYARMIADNAEKLSSTIRNNSVDDLLGMAQDFGRQQPAMFMGAAALLGFAASRFVMASAKRRESPPAAPNSTYTANSAATGSYSADNAATGSQGATGGPSMGEL